MIPREALAEPESIGPTPAVLALVVVAREKEGVGDLPAEFAGYVYVPNQADHSRLRHREGRTANHPRSIRFYYLGLSIEHEAERSSDWHERERFE